MFASLRQSMSWLHTWAGMVFGSLLLVIFFMGTLSVFDREIDRWMMPSTRLPAVDSVSIDKLRPEIERVANGASQWSVLLPNAREPVVRVLALPFHFMIPLSGLIIFFSIYLPSGIEVAYQGNRDAFFDEGFSRYKRPKARQPGELQSIDAMTAEARKWWGSGEPGFVRVLHAGDANAYVEVRRQPSDRISTDSEVIYFDGVTGK